MIGASGIMRLASAIEVALQMRQPFDIVEGILTQLAFALTTLREDTASLLQVQPPLNADAKELHCPNIDADIDKLCTLLDCQNIAAIEEFALLSPSLSELVGAVRFERLREAIDNLDFQVGAELLREALSVGMRTMGRGALDELRSAAD